MTVNALHPGFTATGFAQNNGKVMAVLVKVFAPSVKCMTGKYFYDSQVIPAAPQANDMVVAGKLWEVSAEMVHLADGLSARTQRPPMP